MRHTYLSITYFTTLYIFIILHVYKVGKKKHHACIDHLEFTLYKRLCLILCKCNAVVGRTCMYATLNQLNDSVRKNSGGKRQAYNTGQVLQENTGRVS